MPGLSKVIVVDPDARASRQVQLGFEREGVAVRPLPAEVAGSVSGWPAPDADAGAVIVGGHDGAVLDQVHKARAWLTEHKRTVPLILVDRGLPGAAIARADAEAAGADEIVHAPAYLRDVVTISRLLGGRSVEQRGHVVGNLADIAGVFPLVRALAALGRSATLSLVRGLRRGEIRFFHGEVTSAQIGMIHGQAALHQLLLWTDARFDFQHEDIVRRQQIPLTPDELFADAERFLESVRESSGGLSPSMVLEQNLPRVQSFGKQIPTEVHGVLRMFDGYRVLADVLEDSAYRVFETLRVAQRAMEIGLLRIADRPVIKTTWKSMLAIEDWLLGHEARDAIETGPLPKMAGKEDDAASGRKAGKKGRRKKKKPAAAATQEINWGALVPRTVGGEVGALSGVVPAAQASGEIEANAAAERELGAAQPKVVLDEPAAPASEPPKGAPKDAVSATAPTPVQPFPAVEPPAEVTLEAEAPSPDEVVDPPSDGVIVHHITTADTAPVKRRRPPPGDIPVDDRPGDATGEITMPRARPATPEPRPDEPSILVADLVEIPSGQVTAPNRVPAGAPAVTAPAEAPAEAPIADAEAAPIAVVEPAEPALPRAAAPIVPPDDADLVNIDGASFSDVEEAFFRDGHGVDAGDAIPKAHDVESFADLDAGYRRVGFWDRLRGRAPRPRDPSEDSRPFRVPVAATPTAQPPITAPAEPAARKPSRKEHTTQRSKPGNKKKR